MTERPLALLVRGVRQALVQAGLKRVVIETEVGPQVAFVGGSGPVVVLVHGAGDHAGTWAAMVPQLLAGHTLILPDLAGHGESAPAAGLIEAADICHGLEAVIAATAGGVPVTLVGNSLGSWMAMVVARRHPEWVERVVGIDGGPLKQENPQVSLLPQTREEARVTFSGTRDHCIPPMSDQMLDDLLWLVREGPLGRFAATAANMEAWLLTEDQLAELKLPVRLIWGASDRLMPLAYARRMVAVLPDVELAVIEGCGHVPQLEAPDRLLPVLMRMLPA